jgi:hypothetical protein
MSEPHSTLVGTGLAAAATVILGPVLGEYAVILGLGLLGTLVALSESDASDFKTSCWFLFRGVSFSFVFTGALTWFLLKSLPDSLGFTPYAVMGMVSFGIGWTSDRWASIKETIVNRISSIGVKK